jgi:hypothetical protein
MELCWLKHPNVFWAEMIGTSRAWMNAQQPPSLRIGAKQVGTSARVRTSARQLAHFFSFIFRKHNLQPQRGHNEALFL